MKKDFRIRICSDTEYEEMVADICYKNQTVAMITQEEGINAMQIELFSRKNGNSSLELPLDDFLETVQQAKIILIRMDK